MAFGYIEKEEGEGETRLFNSAAVLDREGKLVCNHRKWHLYYNDKFWAREGSSFVYFDLVTT